MIVGDISTFAIESHFTGAIQARGWPWGTFVIHVAGREYGINKADWTHFWPAVNAARNFLKRRGSHQAPIAADAAAIEIASTVRYGIYHMDRYQDVFLGYPAEQLANKMNANGCLWLECDEAFDDWSKFVILDHGARVRLIAFTHVPWDEDIHPTLREVWLDSDFFYGTLHKRG